MSRGSSGGHLRGALAQPGAPESQRHQVQQARDPVEHPKGLGEGLELGVVGFFGIVRPDFANLVAGSQLFLDGVPLVHDPGGGRLKVQEVQENAHQNDPQRHRDALGVGDTVGIYHHRAARGNGHADGQGRELKVGRKEAGLEASKDVPRKGLEHDDPRDKADPNAAPEPGRKRQEVDQDARVAAAAAAGCSCREIATSTQNGHQHEGPNELLVDGRCGFRNVRHGWLNDHESCSETESSLPFRECSSKCVFSRLYRIQFCSFECSSR